jgi:hypothetical protein
VKSPSPPLPDSFPKKPTWFDEHYGGDEDEWAANCFLMGYDKLFSADGRPISCDPSTFHDPMYAEVSYLTRKDEAFGREALIRVLADCLERNKPLPAILLKHLIVSFAENREDLIAVFLDDEVYERKLILKRRSKNWQRRTKPRAIAYFIQERMQATGDKWPEAVEAARRIFGRNGRRAARSTITDAWASDKKNNPDLHLPVRSDRRSSRT